MLSQSDVDEYFTLLSTIAASGRTSKMALTASQTSSPRSAPNFWIHSLHAGNENEQSLVKINKCWAKVKGFNFQKLYMLLYYNKYN